MPELDDTSLEARLRRLEDVEEIRALLLEYGRRLDAADFVGYAELFAKEGELDAQLGRAIGRAAIVALLEERLGSQPDRPRPPAVHFNGNPAVTLDGNRASSEVIWAYVTRDHDGFPLLLQLGHYYDELVREDGAWRFERRRITRDLGFSPLDAPARGQSEETR
jgi:hypothetical protein